jgi:hypothetical protein
VLGWVAGTATLARSTLVEEAADWKVRHRDLVSRSRSYLHLHGHRSLGWSEARYATIVSEPGEPEWQVSEWRRERCLGGACMSCRSLMDS